MANKKITDLSQVSAFEAGDLTLIRKSGRADDTKIAFQDIVKSIGNPSVNGFTAVSTAANKITLTPANGGAEIDTYYDGMRISFISPIPTDGIVTVDIGALGDKELKIINTNDTAVLSQNDYVEAIYIGNALTGKFYQTNLKVKSNQISDLTEVSSFTTGDFMSIHKSGAIDDNKMSYNNLVKSLGNSSVFGFNATSTEANKIILTPANGGTTIDAYYEKMIVKFISPINTSGATYIKIGSLPEKQLYKINTSNFSTLTANTVVEAIYIGDKFYQTNIAESVIFTNEYNVDSATINAQNTATTYILSSAIGITKTQYYKGQSIAFTSPIDSKGAIYVNVDGLGLKPIVDPDGDPVPFNFYKNQRVMPVYDGVKFIKHILSDIEPEEPQPDPLVPPQDIVITVNPTDILQNIYNKVVQDYGENGGGRKVVLNLPSTPSQGGSLNCNINKNTPWITIKGNNTQVIYSNNLSERGNITFSGTFFCSNKPFIQGNNTNEVQSVTFKDCNFSCTGSAPIIDYPNYLNITAQNCEFVANTLTTNSFFINYQSQAYDSRSNIILDNVKFTNFHVHIINSGNTIVKNLTYTGADSVSSGYVLFSFQKGTYTIDNLQLTIFVNNTGEISRLLDCSATISNSKITASGTYPTRAIGIYSSKVTINSGDYRRLNATPDPDILVSGAGSILYRKSEVLGVSQAINGGVIQNI